MELPPGQVAVLRPVDGTALDRFAEGLVAPLRGAAFLIRNPGLLPLALAPVGVNLVVFAGGVLAVVLGVPSALEAILPRPEGGMGEAAWTLAAFLSVMVLLAVLLAVQYLVAGLLATPFLDRLSERVEHLLLGPSGQPFHLDRFVRDLSVSVLHSLLTLFLYGLVVVPLLALELVPVAGSVLAGVTGGITTSVFLAREMLDGPLTRRRLRYRSKLTFVFRHLAFLGGLGASTALLLWVPGLNLLLQPIAVTGATLAYCRLEAHGQGAVRRW